MDTYRGYEITKTAAGLFEWTDEKGRVHTGFVDMRGGFRTAEAAMADIDAYLRRERATRS